MHETDDELFCIGEKPRVKPKHDRVAPLGNGFLDHVHHRGLAAPPGTVDRDHETLARGAVDRLLGDLLREPGAVEPVLGAAHDGLITLEVPELGLLSQWALRAHDRHDMSTNGRCPR